MSQNENSATIKETNANDKDSLNHVKTVENKVETSTTKISIKQDPIVNNKAYVDHKNNSKIIAVEDSALPIISNASEDLADHKEKANPEPIPSFSLNDDDSFSESNTKKENNGSSSKSTSSGSSGSTVSNITNTNHDDLLFDYQNAHCNSELLLHIESSFTDLTSLNPRVDNSIPDSPGRSRSKHELAAGYGFNEDQIGVFEETFQIFDKDSDGFITLIEIRTVMNSLGFFPCDDIIRKSIENIDNDNSGTVDFEEFICMMSKFRKIKNNHELDEELMEIFKIFDRNQDGYIDKEELKDVLIKLGENITDEEVAEMIKEADIDGDSKVSFTEFRSILHDNRSR